MSPGIIQALPDTITTSELRVLELAGTSTLCAKEIAARLNISVSCVKNHLHHIYKKLGLRREARTLGNRIRLMQWCCSKENGANQ